MYCFSSECVFVLCFMYYSPSLYFRGDILVGGQTRVQPFTRWKLWPALHVVQLGLTPTLVCCNERSNWSSEGYEKIGSLQNTYKPLYITVHYTMIPEITWFKDGSQPHTDYIEQEGHDGPGSFPWVTWPNGNKSAASAPYTRFTCNLT